MAQKTVQEELQDMTERETKLLEEEIEKSENETDE